MCMRVLSRSGCHSFLGCLHYLLGGPCSSAILNFCICGSCSVCLWFHTVTLGLWWAQPCSFWRSPWPQQVFNLIWDEAGLKVVVGKVFLHYVFRYGSSFQSLQMYVEAQKHGLCVRKRGHEVQKLGGGTRAHEVHTRCWQGGGSTGTGGLLEVYTGYCENYIFKFY